MDAEDPYQRKNQFLYVPEDFPGLIPAELHSVFEGGPFRVCNVCEQVLVQKDLYEIQKVFRGKECVFEMAICRACGENLAREFSEESIAAIKGFLLCNYRSSGESEPQHCQFCGFPRRLFRNFTLYGACRDQSLVFPALLMCEKCGERLGQKLSRKTRDVQGEFVRDHFPGIPADFEFSPSFGSVI